MQMVNFASRSIAAAGYENGMLLVAFRGGGLYRYDGVPPSTASQLFSAASKGRFYQSFIKGRFPCVRIR